MNNDDENSQNSDSDSDSLPLRNDGHEVEVVIMPDEQHEVLGRNFEVEEARKRQKSISYWDSTADSPRNTTPRSEYLLRTALELRTRTSLSYQVPEQVRARLNRMQAKSENKGRKENESREKGRVSVKIGS